MRAITNTFAYSYANIWIYRLDICARLSICEYMDYTYAYANIWTTHMH